MSSRLESARSSRIGGRIRSFSFLLRAPVVGDGGEAEMGGGGTEV